jgi:hypothetical protein
LFTPVLTYRGTGVPNLTGACRAAATPFDTAKTSSDKVNLWYSVTPDGGNDSGMSGTSGVLQWRQWACKLRSAAEQQQGIDNNQLPMLVANKTWKLYPGEYLLVRVDPVTPTDNNPNSGWFCSAVWQEEDITTYTISGVVTLSSTGVVGAKVTVLVADDTSLTNAYLHEVVTTTAGGAWTSNIPTGKIAYAYGQNYTGGIYYTAPGAPYIS